MLGTFLENNGHIFGVTTEDMQLVGNMAITEDQKKLKANMQDHSKLHSVDHMVGKEQGML